MAAARQVDQRAHTVAGLEARVSTAEASTNRADDVWQRIARVEQAIEELRSQPAAAEAERRVMARVSALEARVDQQDTAIQQLQAHAAQTDAPSRLLAGESESTLRLDVRLSAADLAAGPP